MWCLLLISSLLHAQAPSSSAVTSSTTSLDYWEKDAKLWTQIRDRRRIVVSAKNEKEQTLSKGAGLVDAEVADVWAFATNPEKVKTTSRFLKEFTWNAATGAVVMQIEIMYISYRLTGKAVQKPDPENPRVEFQVFEGDLVPFTAELEIRSAKAQSLRAGAPAFPVGQTLVRITGVSAKDRALSWPLRVALEAVLQRSAGYLREAVELEKAKARAPGTTAQVL